MLLRLTPMHSAHLCSKAAVKQCVSCADVLVCLQLCISTAMSFLFSLETGCCTGTVVHILNQIVHLCSNVLALLVHKYKYWRRFCICVQQCAFSSCQRLVLCYHLDMVRVSMLVLWLFYLREERERDAHAASTIYLLHWFSRLSAAEATCINFTEVQILRSYLREARE